MALVATLVGRTLEADLQKAYSTLAEAFLAHRSGKTGDLSPSDPVTMDRIVLATEGHIDLRPARSVCEKIAMDQERPGEVFNNLGHMFVILQALAVLRDELTLVPTHCAPTQQSTYEGRHIADLQGPGWALEAFGGTDIRNNAKLALDLRSLSAWRAKANRVFLAFREGAYPPIKGRGGEPCTLTGRCPLKRGGPFLATATARLVGERNQVVVLEIDAVTINHLIPNQAQAIEDDQ